MWFKKKCSQCHDEDAKYKCGFEGCKNEYGDRCSPTALKECDICTKNDVDMAYTTAYCPEHFASHTHIEASEQTQNINTEDESEEEADMEESEEIAEEDESEEVTDEEQETAPADLINYSNDKKWAAFNETEVKNWKAEFEILDILKDYDFVYTVRDAVYFKKKNREEELK